MDVWTEGRVEPTMSVEQMLLRYLGAFGPATVMDFQAWSGLTKCRPYFDNLADHLIEYRSEQGQILYDRTDAFAPDMTDVPVRFLYDYDNVLLAYRTAPGSSPRATSKCNAH
ncbi:DNA glycosylase AlkZ-like family protein [Arthrobacter sp. ATA002]|uniref:DNA glycosylase AlkZ-like family protein n=1 Tax=Arthrobacter sp. ATA002 TaxID=2991715 RepID=UPI003FA42979